MISWIQKRLIKNGRWIFSILLAVLIVSFVFVIGETPGLVTPQTGSTGQHYYGVNLLNQNELRELDQQTLLMTMLRVGNSRFSASNIRQLSLYRAASLHLADQYQLPVPGKEKLQQFVLDMPMFQDQQGNFDPDAYQQFLDTINNNPGYSTAMLDRAIQDEYRIKQISDILSNQGHVLPYDVALLAEENHTEWTVKVATRRYTEFQPEPAINEEDLQAYFENNALRYETPQKRHISWIYFPSEHFLDDVEDPGDEALLDHLEAHIYRFLDAEEDRDPENPQQSLEPDALLQKKRDAVLRDWKMERAQTVARLRAEDFATELYDNRVEQNSDRFREMVESLGLESGSFNPVARDTSPRRAGEGATWDILQTTRNLNASQWFTDAIEFREGYGIFYITEIEEPKIPEFSEVREAVETDYRETLRKKQFNETGNTIAASIRENIDAGLEFEAAVAKSEIEPYRDLSDRLYEAYRDGDTLRSMSGRSALLQIVEYEAFTRNTMPESFPEGIFNSLKNMNEGDVSDMITIGNLGYFVYVEDKNKPDLQPEADAYLTAVDTLEYSAGNFIMRNSMQELLERGLPEGVRMPDLNR